jgi:hypothetical protein
MITPDANRNMILDKNHPDGLLKFN